MIHLPHLHRPGSSRCTSRRSSADYSHHPHPPAASLRPPTLDASPSSSPSPWSSRRSSACWSDRSCEGLTPDRTVDLWRCMLDLQGRYACYHSARIDVAMEAGHEDAVRYMPNRFIIDILNDSVVDTLPDEGWEMLNHYLHDDHLDAKI